MTWTALVCSSAYQGVDSWTGGTLARRPMAFFLTTLSRPPSFPSPYRGVGILGRTKGFKELFAFRIIHVATCNGFDTPRLCPSSCLCSHLFVCASLRSEVDPWPLPSFPPMTRCGMAVRSECGPTHSSSCSHNKEQSQTNRIHFVGQNVKTKGGAVH